MLGNLFFSAALAALLLLVVNLGIRRYVSVDYLLPENVAERDRLNKEELQSYVTDNGVTSEDVDKLSEWAADNKYWYVLIFKADELLFESGRENAKTEENKENEVQKPSNSVENGKTETENESIEDKYFSSGITVIPPSREDLITDALEGGSYPIHMADGVVLLAYMTDYTEYLYYDVANILSFLLALVAFIVTMWLHFYGITKRISSLGKEVTIVAEGDMEHPIVAKGNDEITRLSMDVEYMRTSMLENVQKQYNALEANKDLITAMSHDIRTPLTVLLGYLEIMKLNAPEGEMKNYIEASERTAMRLKKMSDDMFGYFLVYGGELEVDIQECNARTLVEQMISGHVFLLREQGYTIEYNFENEAADFLEDVVMVTDPPQLMRIFENVFSNVTKYADKEKPVLINISFEIDEMTIKVSNTISKNPDEAQKNGIGLQSCMKLANAMDIRFSSEEEGDIFTSVMNVPIIPNIQYDDVENEEEKGGFAEWVDSVSEKLKATFAKLWKKITSTVSKIKEKLSKKK